MPVVGRSWPLAVTLLLACRPDTTRPAFTPLPEAAAVEIRLSPVEATRRLAERLQADSIRLSLVRLRDGYIETRWLDSATGRPTSRRPVGAGVVRVRAWADPARPGSSVLTVETLYRPLADPSLPERELERQVPRDHPTAVRVERTLKAMLERYGGPPLPSEQPAPVPPARRPPAAERPAAQPPADSGADETPEPDEPSE
jgi:hypothetical protein